ncbi:MAG: hypothetical protein K2N95_14690 [Lachnospiraceae bacterium]|nr:hypothetical protein [Lachnospiraceae bacterium]
MMKAFKSAVVQRNRKKVVGVLIVYEIKWFMKAGILENEVSCFWFKRSGDDVTLLSNKNNKKYPIS